MSVTIFRRKTQIGSIILDTLLSDSTTFTNEITQYPIEDGSNISDHVIHKPITISLNCFISNTPIDAEYSQNRITSAYDELKILLKSKEFITVVTGLEVYDNMMVSSLSIPRDVKTNDALYFTITFQEVQKVSSSLTQIGDLKDQTTQDQAGSTVHKNEKKLEKPTETQINTESMLENSINGDASQKGLSFGGATPLISIPFVQ